MVIIEDDPIVIDSDIDDEVHTIMNVDGDETDDDKDDENNNE